MLHALLAAGLDFLTQPDPLLDSLVTTLPTEATPITGRRWWVLVWYAILALGVAGLWGAIYWGRRTRWQNLDELFRAVGTICVSLGMVMLLKRTYTGYEFLLIVAALVCFVIAFVAGRRQHPERERGDPPAMRVADSEPGDDVPGEPAPVARRDGDPRSQPFG